MQFYRCDREFLICSVTIKTVTDYYEANHPGLTKQREPSFSRCLPQRILKLFWMLIQQNYKV